MLFVQRHHLFLLLLLLGVSHAETLVLVVDLLDERLQGLHLLHRFHALPLQREGTEIDKAGNKDNGPTVVGDDVGVGPPKHEKNRLGDETPVGAEVDDFLEFGSYGAEDVDALWAHEKVELVAARCADSDSGEVLFGYALGGHDAHRRGL